MIQQTVTIQNKLGLHARASSKFVEVAKEYLATISVTSPFAQANGKSIMNMMLLQATCHSEIAIEIEGEDEQEAMTALLALINNKFDEAE
ncbi:MAG: phosphocarrier protein [Candidatus Azotimanducaceae bacterium]